MEARKEAAGQATSSAAHRATQARRAEGGRGGLRRLRDRGGARAAASTKKALEGTTSHWSSIGLCRGRRQSTTRRPDSFVGGRGETGAALGSAARPQWRTGGGASREGPRDATSTSPATVLAGSWPVGGSWAPVGQRCAPSLSVSVEIARNRTSHSWTVFRPALGPGPGPGRGRADNSFHEAPCRPLASPPSAPPEVGRNAAGAQPQQALGERDYAVRRRRRSPRTDAFIHDGG